MEASVNRCERIQRTAGRSLLSVAVLDAAHVLTAFLSSSPEKLTAPTLVGVIAMNIALVWALVWAGKGVTRGVRIAAALGILGFMGLGFPVALAMALANGYDAALALTIVQILLLVSVFMSLFLVVRLWLVTIQKG